jgi:hypothetical protein
MSATVWVDGICCQLAGELIFDVASSGAERGQRALSYIRALEDAAFLILFSPSICVAGSMPPTQGAHPGRQFLDYVAVNSDTLVKGSEIELPPLESVVTNDPSRANIVAQLAHVGEAFNNERGYWFEALDREARAFLGNDRSVLRDSFDSSVPVVFSRPGGYIFDPALEAQADSSCVEALLARLVETFPAYHPDALRRLVLQFFVTHFAIGEGYDSASEKHGAFRFPTVTRSEVRRLTPHRLSAYTSITISDITKAGLSLALKSIQGGPRKNIIDYLVDLRCRSEFKIFRSLVGDYTDATTVADGNAAERALVALRESFRGDHDSTVAIHSTKTSGYFLRDLRGAREQYPDSLSRVFKELTQQYSDRSPIPTVAAPVRSRPIPPRLKWEKLSALDFERLLFELVCSTEGYENPKLVMNIYASDGGRDISVDRIVTDPLLGTKITKLFIQCKHWRSKSISGTTLSALKDQIQAANVNILVIATTGSFTKAAVDQIESHNRADRALEIEMWAGTHLELLLGARPDLVERFHLTE